MTSISANSLSILICGNSYGAAIGCSTVNFSEAIIGFVAISFPWDFMGTKYKDLTQTEKPKLFIQGDRDSIANYDKFQSHYEFYKKPKEKVIIKGADHFYLGSESIVATEIIKFIKNLINTRKD